MKPNRHRFAQELSLVPLADMLTNTVGITIFVLILTVLAAGGAVVVKRLPLEQKTEAAPMHFLCIDGRIYPIDQALVREFIDPLGKPKGDFEGWSKRFNARRLESNDVVVTGKSGFEDINYGGFVLREPEVSVTFTPKPNGGESTAEVGGDQSPLRIKLSAADPSKAFAHFLVRPDGIEAFNVARDVAQKLGYQTGWAPLGEKDDVTFSLTGRGRAATKL